MSTLSPARKKYEAMLAYARKIDKQAALTEDRTERNKLVAKAKRIRRDAEREWNATPNLGA